MQRHLLALLILVSCSIVSFGQVISDFSVDDEGWTIFNTSSGGYVTIGYNSTGGNPGGYITDGGTFSGPTILYAEAPSKFKGNFSSSYRQNLTFDLKTDFVGTDNTNGDILIAGTGGTLYYQLPSKPGTSFTSYIVKLDETISGWHFNGVSAPAPTQAQMKTVLGNINSLRIRTKYTTSNTFTATGSLDNVVLNVQALGTPPSITSFNPASGIPTVASVTIKGNNFGSSASTNAVYFGGVKAVITSASSTQLVVAVPKGAQNAPIIVENLTTSLSCSTIKPFVPLFDNNQDFGGRIIRASLAPPAAFDVQLNGTKGTNAVGDIDGDGLNDLVVGEGAGGFSGSKQFSVFRNAGVTGTVSSSSFLSKVSFTVSQPYTKGYVSLADFDVDGKLDVVMSSADNSYAYVSVFRNTSSTGSISFAAPIDFVGYSYSDGPLATADMDGDGRPEILGVFNNNCAAGDRLYIYQNLSSPGNIDFAAYSSFANVYTCGGNITVGDIDGDLLNDVVVTAGQNSVTIFKNTSIPGKLTMASAFQLSTTSTGNVTIADLDQDGLPDLAWPYTSGQNIIIRKNIYAGGTFDATAFSSDVVITSPVGIASTELTSGDFNGDGKIDLVMAGNADMAIFENVSTGGSINSQSFLTGVPMFVGAGTSFPYAPLLADFDGDNKQDVVIRLAGASGANIGALLVYHNESFKAPQISSISPSSTIGNQVAITGNYLNTANAIPQARISNIKASSSTPNNTTTNITVPVGAISGPASLTEHGLTVMSKQFNVLFGTNRFIGASSFGPEVDFTLAANTRDALVTSDWDDDGKPDVGVIENFSTVRIFRNTATSGQSINNTSLTLSPTTFSGGYNMLAFDIDGDGKTDLNSGFGLLQNNSPAGAISFLPSVASTTTGFNYAAYADFNKDGKLDMAVTNGTLNIQVYENQSDKTAYVNNSYQSTFTASTTNLAKPNNYGGIVTADFDGDGYEDILSTNQSANNISYYLNQKQYGPITSSSFSFLGNYSVSGSQPISLTANDFDGDGRMDIAVAFYNSTFASVYFNTSSAGDISFSSGIDLPCLTRSYNITSQDLDGDGKPEIVVIHRPNPGPGSFSVFQNKSTTGNANFNAVVNYTLASPARNPQAVAIADINQDQKPDILIVADPYTAPTPALMVFENKIASLVLTIDTQPANVTVCSGQTISFSTAASGTTNITYQWQYSPDGIAAYSDISNGSGYSNATSATLLINTAGNFGAGRYKCKITGDFVATAFTVDKGLTLNTSPTPPTTTGATGCPATSLALNASGGTNGQYRWYTALTGGTAITGETNSSYLTPSLSVSTDYYVAINNGSCESTRTIVTAQINTAPTAPTTTGASSCTASALTLNASTGSNGQYRWYSVPTGGTAIAGEVNSSYTTPSISTTTTYYVSISNGTCESPRTSVVAQINTTPIAPTTITSAACGTSSLTINASGGTNGQYRWYTVLTGGTAIAGEVNSSYTTPVLTNTTTYYVAINNTFCESTRTSVVAQINALPAAPITTAATGCNPSSVTLIASGGTNGQYRWYTTPTGGTSIPGEVNNSYVTPTLNTTTIYYVAINNSTCESTRTSVQATINTCISNLPPDIKPSDIATQIEGKVTLNLAALISDPDNNLDLSTLRIIAQPESKAIASIDANDNLIIDYKGISFTGVDHLTIEVCDLAGSCTQKQLSIEVAGDVNVYNGISPNGDDKNPIWIIEFIDILEDTKKNHVSLFDRWGDVVFEVDNYDNKNRVFTGINKNGNEVGSGIYFYKIEFASGKATKTGYLNVKK